MTDQQLWQALKRGDNTALETIYRTHVSHLINYGQRLCNDDMLVQDCLQDLFVYLWQKRESINSTDAIRPYLLVAFRRRLIRAMTSRNTKVDYNLEQIHFEAEWSFEDNLVTRDIAEEQRQQLRAGLEKLSARQREALFLRYYEGLTYEEISSVMDLQYQSVRNLVSKAVSRLRDHFPLYIWLFLWTLIEYK